MVGFKLFAPLSILLALFVQLGVEASAEQEAADIAKYADENRFSLKGMVDWENDFFGEQEVLLQNAGKAISEQEAEECTGLEKEAAHLFKFFHLKHAEVEKELSTKKFATRLADDGTHSQIYYFPGKFTGDGDLWDKQNMDYYRDLTKQERELNKTREIVLRCYGIVDAFLTYGSGVYSERINRNKWLAEDYFSGLTFVKKEGRKIARYAAVKHLVEGTMGVYEKIMPDGEKEKLTESDRQTRDLGEKAEKAHGGKGAAFYW